MLAWCASFSTAISGSDTDDACALAMLLGWPDVELVGITTAHYFPIYGRRRPAMPQVGMAVGP
jgi:hypothetical protein